MEQMVTAVCRTAGTQRVPVWAHWVCLDAPAPDTPRYLRTDCTCWCHTADGEGQLPAPPERELPLVPRHRREAARRT